MVALVQTATFTGVGSVTSITSAAFGSSTTLGNKLTCSANWWNSAGGNPTVTMSDSNVNTWTTDKTVRRVGTGAPGATIASAPLTVVGSGSTVKITTSLSCNIQGVAHEWSGLGTAVDVSNSNTGGTGNTSLTVATGTNTNPVGLLVAMLTGHGTLVNSGISDPPTVAGATTGVISDFVNQDGTTLSCGEGCYKILSVSTAQSVVWTFTSSTGDGFVGAAVVYKGPAVPLADDEPPALRIALRAPLTQPPDDDEQYTIGSKVVDEDPQPVLMILPLRFWPQPPDDDEQLVVLQPIGEDDFTSLLVPIARIVPQPPDDDEQWPLGAKQFDEDPQPVLVMLPVRIWPQPPDDDEQLPSLPNEDDHLWPLSWLKARAWPQPLADDEVVSSQPPVDDEAGWPLTWIPLRLWAQPPTDDDALPLQHTIVDDDYDPTHLRVAYLRPNVQRTGAFWDEDEFHAVPVAGIAAVVRLDTYDRGDGSVLLAWENFPGIPNADSFNVYADGVLIGNVPAPGLQFVAGGYSGAKYDPSTGITTPPQSHVFNIVAIKGGGEIWTTLPVRVTFQPATVAQVTPMARPYPFPSTGPL